MTAHSELTAKTPRTQRISLLILGALGVLAVFFAVCVQVQAQTPDPALDDQVHDVAKQMNCPTCAGRNLADCPTDTCKQWKDEIRSQLVAGKSAGEVLDYFSSRFGPTVMQEPPKEGAVLIVWVLPVIAVVLLLAAGVWAVRRASARKPMIAPSGPPSMSEAEDPYVAEIEEQVKQP